MYEIQKDSKIRRGGHLQNWCCHLSLNTQLINYDFSIDLSLWSNIAQCTSNFWALSISLQFLKMAPAPNFGVFLDFAHPFLTEVDFRWEHKNPIFFVVSLRDLNSRQWISARNLMNQWSEEFKPQVARDPLWGQKLCCPNFFRNPDGFSGCNIWLSKA